MSEWDLHHIESIVEHRKRLLVDIEHYKGTIEAQAFKIKELKTDNELLYNDNQKLQERVKRLEKDLSILLATTASKAL